jgi:nicotinamidase-related amidase
MEEAILVVDMLREFVTGGAGFEEAKKIVPRIRRLLEFARARGVPVVYVCDSHEPGDHEFRVWGPHALRGSEGAKVVPELEPEKTDKVVPKSSYSGFFRTELEAELSGIKRLILTGVYTDVCVLSTALDAFYRGFEVVIPQDCVASPDHHAHRVFLEHLKKVCGAEIIDSEELIKRWQG